MNPDIFANQYLGAKEKDKTTPAQQQQQRTGFSSLDVAQTDLSGIQGLGKYIQGMNQQAADTAAKLSADIEKQIGSLKISDALGYKQGLFDVPDGVKVVDQVIKHAAGVAGRAFEDGIIGSMMMSNGRIQEGMTMYNEARKQGDNTLSMMQRVATQYGTLHDPNASESEKAMARTNLGKTIGNRAELVQATQALMPGMASLAAAKVATESAKSQVLASSYGPLASLMGLSSQRWGSLISNGGQSAQDLSDLVKAHNNVMGVYAAMLKDEDSRETPEFKQVSEDFSGLTKFISGKYGYEPTINTKTEDFVYQGQ